ncbi:MAG: saccharopine dehydrogenase family protein [Thermodesulfobacteriota bacterium]
MNILVLGMGFQGKAVVHDLEQSPQVKKIIAADQNREAAAAYIRKMGFKKTTAAEVDARNTSELEGFVKEAGVDVLVCMLPWNLAHGAARAALNAGIHFVDTSYAGPIREMDAAVKEKGLTFLVEFGLDPGIDLVMGRWAVDRLDQVHGLNSYGAGIPEPACADTNPIRYKLTWTLDGVLKTYVRPARFLKDGKEQTLPGTEIFKQGNFHVLEIPGLGSFEAYYNGDAVQYIDIFGLKDTVRDMGRFAFRWPGHCEFWSKMAGLGLLDDTPVPVGESEISPREFLVRQLTPRLQFEEKERDLVVILVRAWGMKDGRAHEATCRLIDYRDLETGLFAMNRTVGYTASIGAQMILSGKVAATGVISAAREVSPEDLIPELKRRGMHIEMTDAPK